MDVLGTIEKGFGKVNATVFRQVNRVTDWWNLPTPLGLLNLRGLRDDLRESNLFDTRAPANGDAPPTTDALPDYRTYDGSRQDPTDPEMGKVGTRFGRNAPTEATEPEPLPQRMEPNPREVANRLLLRDSFKPATSLNVLAACWIQFQNHDWFGHGENDPENFIEVELPPSDDWPDGEVMKVKATIADRTRTWKSGLPPTFVNTVTHWWDLSQVYGSTEERNRELRSGEDGKLKIEDGMLPNETEKKLDGVDLTGFSDNYWIGLSLLHTLFAKEHNAICDHLKGSYPTWDDERLFLTARLVNSALSAKIHTVEWTPGILANPVLERAMHANWYGILPQWVRKRFGHVGTEMIGGIVGSDQEHHTAPYAITEEFISVYRLHPLLPDDYEIRDHESGEVVEEIDFDPIQGKGTRPSIEKFGWSNLLYSFGIANPGAITLKNHPKALSNHVRLNGDRVDLGTIDILRDRERGVPRYNDFREKLRKKRLTKFEDLSDDPKLVEEIRDVYSNDIDRVDLQVGMLAEPLPPGFGFSDTAFRIFILMASRRLRSDRFFTNDYSPDVYTPEGLRWVEESDMKDVLLRHHPELAPALEGVENAFANATVVVPNAIQGIFRRRRRAVRAATAANVDGHAVGLLEGMNRSYGGGPVWVKLARDDALLLLDPEDVGRALDESPDPFASDPDAKRKGMVHFQPDALTISRGAEWKSRRRFTEAVLGAAVAERVETVAREEVRDLVAGPVRQADGELRWRPWNRAIQRITRRVVLGDSAAGDWALTETLERMMSGANGMPGEPADDLPAFERRLQAYTDRHEEGSLAAGFGDAPQDALTKPAGQVAHWLFALGDTLAINALRALAALASHETQRDLALAEHDGAHLDACLHEAMRLWPTTTMLSRVSVAPTLWSGVEVPEGTQLVISNTYGHRDRERLEFADRFAPEQWTEGNASAYRGFNHFSRGPQGCPGTALALLVGRTAVRAVLERGIEPAAPKLNPEKPLPHMVDFFGIRVRVGA